MTSDGAGATPDAPVDAVEFYWRPGCMFCKHLEWRLRRARVPLRHHNIWEDPDAAAIVRSIASGNETVPTVVVGTERFVNPSTREVLDALRRQAPQLDVAADADLDE
ncbi:MAG: NrdH-redoxin [Microthrixaceae bacterium]|nr:NrdH-redoxin [Actinomycetota bacterium]MBP6728128.1 NrdH-redoxin [Microthrixaceae bacterium]